MRQDPRGHVVLTIIAPDGSIGTHVYSDVPNAIRCMSGAVAMQTNRRRPRLDKE